MSNVTGEIIGAEELSKALVSGGSAIVQALSTAISKAAYTAERLAKAAAPVQYGQLRGSITTQTPIVSADNIEARVGTNVKYAPYQEFGTGIYAGKGMIVPKRAKVLAWQGKGGWIFARAVKGVKGKFFFRESRAAVLPELNAQLKNIADTLMKHLQG